MSEKLEFIVSDVHLGAVPATTEREFLRFLEHVRARGSRLLIPGDLFDFWFEYGTVIPGRHFRTLAALSGVVETGIPVLMLGGNHDAWGGSFLRDYVGVEFHPGPVRTNIAGRPALVAHGDGLGKGDWKYRALKTILRSRIATGGFRALHPELGLRLARAVSQTEEKADQEAIRGRAAFLESWAADRLAEDGTLSWVVCGHAHVPLLRSFGAGRYYVNSGDWVRHRTYVTVDPAGTPTLQEWS